MVDGGIFLGVWSLLLRLLLCFIYRLVPCENAEATQETEGDASPPRSPPRMRLQIPISSFSIASARQKPAGVINFAAQCHGFNRRGG